MQVSYEAVFAMHFSTVELITVICGDHNSGHHRVIAIIEGLFCAQTVYFGPGCFL